MSPTTSVRSFPQFRRSIEYRMLLKLPRAQQQNLMSLYSPKFNALMDHIRPIRVTPSDYSNLRFLRQIIRKIKMSDMLPYLPERILTTEGFMLLVDAVPVFDHLPTGIRAYILLCLGVRSSMFNNTELQVS